MISEGVVSQIWDITACDPCSWNSGSIRPLSAQAYGTTSSISDGNVSRREHNNLAFPYSCVVKFSFPEQKEMPPFKLFWWDGGIRPEIPDELDAEDEELPREGMMYVGYKGKILAKYLSL